jgi:hypothetical protein
METKTEGSAEKPLIAINRMLLMTLGLSKDSAGIVLEELDRLWAIEHKAQPLADALREALPIIEEHAEDERAFWGDRHGHAVSAENLLAAVRDALRGWSDGPSAAAGFTDKL